MEVKCHTKVVRLEGWRHPANSHMSSKHVMTGGPQCNLSHKEMRTNHEPGRHLLALTTKYNQKQDVLAGCLQDGSIFMPLSHSEAAMHCLKPKLLKPTIQIYPDSQPLAMQSIIQTIPYAQVTQR
jgi:hypothetical protein